MTPGARLSAAIEILASLEGGRAADRALDGYFRARRYAGSKDRATISGIVYDVIRGRAGLVWRLERAGAPTSPRALVLAHQIAAGTDPTAHCNGAGHAPAPLDETEKAWAATLGRSGADAPDWVKGNYPEWLDGALRARFGERLLEEVAALNGRAPVDLRVNALRATRAEILRELQKFGIPAGPTPLSPLGIRLAGRVTMDRMPHVRDGLAEVQDEGSQIASLMLGARPGEQIVDFCAGAGGKSLAIAAQMKRKGQVYALDSDAGRLDRLRPRAKRAEAHNIQPHVLIENDPWLAAEGARFDRVLVDAPCSGTGTWRRNPEARWRLTPEELAAHAARQAGLLDRAAGLVKRGGRLVYVVCSVLREEGEAPVEAFRAAHPGFDIVPASVAWAEAFGDAAYPGDDPFLLLTPKRHGVDGFFIAVLARRE